MMVKQKYDIETGHGTIYSWLKNEVRESTNIKDERKETKKELLVFSAQSNIKGLEINIWFHAKN